ncbi:polysaccharide lyase family 1 protein [Xylariomycetidae sp. FL2044]|nr:polysaccharide lyase family 1 protein [Xylariomycetidae sp. FL2044]
MHLHQATRLLLLPLLIPILPFLPIPTIAHPQPQPQPQPLLSPLLSSSPPLLHLPSRTPFGYAHHVTGGGLPPPANSTYIVSSMPELRAVLQLATPRTVYVNGTIRGSQISTDLNGSCAYYISTSGVPSFDFALYLRSLNATYTSAVRAAAAAGLPFEGYANATAYLDLLSHQNGWRAAAQNAQKKWESIDAQGNLTLIGLSDDDGSDGAAAALDGVSLVFNSRSNVIVRNLRLSPPRDCFPAPETWPSTWNARYDAVSLVSTTGVWMDGNVFEDSLTTGAPVAPEDLGLWGWQVDRYDGLFDVEDGSDDITFSHNVVANHHKSLLWGGGEKEAERDLGRMRFTVFGNRFVNSSSRNPLMRFGTFYIVGNVFENYENREPLYEYVDGEEDQVDRGLIGRRGEVGINGLLGRRDDEVYMPDFQYHMGIYNLSSVLVSGNYFAQTGVYPDDKTRLFTFSNLATPESPATFCSPPDLSAVDAEAYPQLANFIEPQSALNGQLLNLTSNVFQTYGYYISEKDDSVAGGLVDNCAKFEGQKMPLSFGTADEVYEYVLQNAGQVGRNGS